MSSIIVLDDLPVDRKHEKKILKLQKQEQKQQELVKKRALKEAKKRETQQLKKKIKLSPPPPLITSSSPPNNNNNTTTYASGLCRRPIWYEGVIICSCTICQLKNYPAFDPSNPLDFTKLPRKLPTTYMNKLPRLQLPCQIFSRDDARYSVIILHQDNHNKKRSRLYVRFADVPKTEKDYLQGPAEEPSNYYIYPSLTMAVRRARKKYSNGWEYFEILLQHDGFVYRLPLKSFRDESPQGSGFINSTNYKDTDIDLFEEMVQEIIIPQYQWIENKLKTRYLQSTYQQNSTELDMTIKMNLKIT